MTKAALTLLPAGPCGLLVETDSLERALSVYAELSARWEAGDLPYVQDLVPAARTVLVMATADPGAQSGLRVLAEELAAHRPEERQADGHSEGQTAHATRPPMEIPVRYDGPDLDEVARLSGLSAAEVVTLHAGCELTVAFCGFAPGFAYLTGLPPELHVQRRDSPRTAVPAGSVGLAGEFSGVYPRSSPGGWQLIGRTEVTLWDPHRTPPALLSPGTRVRFTEVRG